MDYVSELWQYKQWGVVTMVVTYKKGFRSKFDYDIVHSKTSKVKKLFEGHYNSLKITASYELTASLFLNDLICPK